MKAIILAAGIGQRLGEVSGQRPKCLLEFNGTSLLLRHLQALQMHPVTEVVIVTGYRHADIETVLSGNPARVPVRTVLNPDFTDGSVVSLWCARDWLVSGTDVLLMDADVLYHPEILRRLVASTHPNCFLLDRDFEPGDEPVKLCVRDGLLIDFRKQIDEDLDFDLQGESVGFFRFSAAIAERLARRACAYIEARRSREPYEETIRDLLLEDPESFAWEDITGLPWVEIDFPADVERAATIARDHLLPMTS